MSFNKEETDLKELNRDINVYSNAETEDNLRNNQRDYIYNALQKKQWSKLEDFRLRSIAYDWGQGYQRTPIFDKNWRERDPILKALRADEDARLHRNPIPFCSGNSKKNGGFFISKNNPKVIRVLF